MSGAPGLSPGARAVRPIVVRLPVTLGQLLKLAGIASTGGEAKRIIAAGSVVVNGAVETRRGHQLAFGDMVEVSGVTLELTATVPEAALEHEPVSAHLVGGASSKMEQRLPLQG